MKLDILVKGVVIAIIGLPVYYCGGFLAGDMSAVARQDSPSLYQAYGAMSYVGVGVFIIGIVVICAGLAMTPKKAGAVAFCPNCGNTLKPGAASCHRCGRKLASRNQVAGPPKKPQGKKEGA